MAFNPKALQLGPSHGAQSAGAANYFRKATYITPDAAAAVETAGYFNAAASRLPKNTLIECVLDTGGTVTAKGYLVTANTGTAVTVAVVWAPPA